jgi:TusA-related sulfurtransferase
VNAVVPDSPSITGSGQEDPPRPPAPKPYGAHTIDAVGRACPLPIIMLARAAASLPAGAQIVLRTDDPAAIHDVPAWCRLRGATYLGRLGQPDAVIPPSGGDNAGREDAGSAGAVENRSGSRQPDHYGPVTHLIRLGPPPGGPG